MERCYLMAHVEQLHSQTIRLSSNNDAMGRLIKFSALSRNGHLIAHKLPPLLPQRVAPLQSTEVLNCFTFLSIVGACCLANATFSRRKVEVGQFLMASMLTTCTELVAWRRPIEFYCMIAGLAMHAKDNAIIKLSKKIAEGFGGS
ncbi:hypothetical protein TIFTF001_030907 [Ficus carica]|uniref:Uncharacterized protein n=1 Tax=Ficus carica TaxID=3494 RepID=A0AA88DUB7_FICCA|nr:hypothetical protein TIFTF001_030907 [Ficus carica]